MREEGSHSPPRKRSHTRYSPEGQPSQCCIGQRNGYLVRPTHGLMRREHTMSRDSLSPETLDAIAAAGFDVYMNPSPMWDTYAFFTDGLRIGYIQYAAFDGLSLSTVHIPNRQTGTGFKLDAPKDLSRSSLEAAFMIAPHWAPGRDRESVKKWAAWEAKCKGSLFGNDLVKVREGVQA